MLSRWRWENAQDGAGRPLLVVISGPAGVGKTALALRWLHGLRDGYPDGQLFVELSESATTPVTPDEALEWMLRSLGVPGQDMPEGRAQRQSLFRTLTAGRCLAVLLDDALSAAQVRALIPAGGHSVVVVTSRWRLSRLAMDGARVLDVDTLDTPASLQLLEAVVGPARIAAEPGAATELAALCGGLPLALAIVGARLAARPRRPLEREVHELRAEHDRLDGLALDEDASVKAVQDIAYRSLHADAQAIYRLVGLHPGPEVGIDVLAAVSGFDRHRVHSAVDEAIEANILTEIDENRLRCHDLTRLHARHVAEQHSPGPAALRTQIIEYYLDRVIAADTLIHPHRPGLGPRYADPTHAEFDDRDGALDWMHTERRNVRAAVRAAHDEGHHDLVWQFCEGLWGFFLHTRRYTEFIELQEIGRDAAARCADPRAEARLCSQQGFAHAKLGEFDEAITLNTRALHLAEQAGDTQATATALSQLGRAARGQGDLPTALEYFRRARDIQHDIGRTRGVALCTRRIGNILARLGHPHEAITELHKAATMMDQLGDPTQHARALMEIGRTQLHTGTPHQALPPLHQALAMMREFGSPYYQAEILGHLAATTHALGDLDTTRTHYREAIDLYTQVGDPKSETLQQRLDSLDA